MTAPCRGVAAAILSALALAACGSDDDGAATETDVADAGRLTAAERELVAQSEAAIVEYCRRRALALTDPDKRPSVAQQARALEAVDALVELAAAKPVARVRRGVDVRLFLGDLAENLEGSNCDPQVVGRLEQGLASLATPP